MTLIFDLLVVLGMLLTFTDKPWWGLGCLLLAGIVWVFFCEVWYVDNDID